MALAKSDNTVETEGLAPKVAWISVALLALGLLLAVADKLLLGDDIPDEVWLTLIGATPGALAVGAAAPPALQKPKLPVSDHAAATPGATTYHRRKSDR